MQSIQDSDTITVEAMRVESGLEPGVYLQVTFGSSK